MASLTSVASLVTRHWKHIRVQSPKPKIVVEKPKVSVFETTPEGPFAQAWVDECRKAKPRSRVTTRKFQKRFLHRDGGPARLHALIFSKSPPNLVRSPQVHQASRE
jgi:hypothetical protein